MSFVCLENSEDKIQEKSKKGVATKKRHVFCCRVNSGEKTSELYDERNY